METFEAEVAQATAPASRDILGAFGFVVNSEGETLYHHASGRQTLEPQAPTLDFDTTVAMASAGKFITHIAALQLVDQGIVGLDDPVYNHLPELENLPIITASDDASSQGFSLRPRSKAMTLRQMLTHSSGIYGEDTPPIKAWRDATKQEFPEDTPKIVTLFSAPLVFEPGEGWLYGNSVHWLQLFIERAAKQKFVPYVHEHIFDPLGMKSSAYYNREDIKKRSLQMVQREKDGKLVPAPERAVGGLMCSLSDVQTLLADLISPTSKILKAESVELFFQPAFAPSSAPWTALRANTEDYEAPAGIPIGTTNPPVNYSIGGLAVEGELPLSHLPAGTVTWNGMPNVVWALHREKRLAMFFATQLLPVDDEKTVAVMMEFLKGAWAKFG